LIGCIQIVDHEVERGIARNDRVFQHQYQVRAAAHFINGHLGSVEYGAHANCAHEPRRFLHAVCLQDDVCHAYGRAFIVLAYFLGAQRQWVEKLVDFIVDNLVDITRFPVILSLSRCHLPRVSIRYRREGHDAIARRGAGAYMSELSAGDLPGAVARPRLFDVVRDAIWRRHYSYRTEETYLQPVRLPTVLTAGETRQLPATTAAS